jgi:hypothetical protein
MAIARKCWSSEVKPACSRAMDLIGATVIPLSSALPLISNAKSAIIDGETIVQNGDGASDFEALSSALRQRRHSIIRCRWVGCASSRTYAWPIESHIELLGKHG